MKRLHLIWILATLLCACQGKKAAEETSAPAIKLEFGCAGADFVSIHVQAAHVTQLSCWVQESWEKEPAKETILGKGKVFHLQEEIVIYDLSPWRQYTLYAVGTGPGGNGSIEKLNFTTGIGSIPASRRHDRTPSLSRMVLLFGFWRHDTSGNILEWSKERISPLVSWTDPADGKEKWLFDTFLALEGCTQDAANTFMLGTHEYGSQRAKPAANKAHAQAFLDWWMRESNGFHALDQAIEETTLRIGEPPSARYVIMMMPDLSIHERYNESASSTLYWGQAPDGHRMNFANPGERAAAYHWWIDTVRERFDAAGFKHLRLGGFYILTEELPTTRPGLPGMGDDGMDGWEQQYKAWDEVFPEVSNYIHLSGECVVWIPYRNAAGYRFTSELGIDYTLMQPNLLWADDETRYSMDTYLPLVQDWQMGMELEFDDNILGSAFYRNRWNQYIQTWNRLGKQIPVALYQDTESFNHFRLSDNPEDNAVYEDLCRRITD